MQLERVKEKDRGKEKDREEGEGSNLACNRMLAGGDPHLQPEGDVARGVGKDSFI